MFSLNLAHKFQFINTLIFTNPHTRSNGISPPKQLAQGDNNFYKANCTHIQNTALHWKTNLTGRKTHINTLSGTIKRIKISTQKSMHRGSVTSHYRNRSISTSTCIHVWITLSCITRKSIELRAQHFLLWFFWCPQDRSLW